MVTLVGALELAGVGVSSLEARPALLAQALEQALGISHVTVFAVSFAQASGGRRALAREPGAAAPDSAPRRLSGEPGVVAGFSVKAGLGAAGFGTASEFEAAVEAALMEGVASGELTTQIALECGCAVQALALASLEPDKEYPTLFPTARPTAPPSPLPSVAPSLASTVVLVRCPVLALKVLNVSATALNVTDEALGLLLAAANDVAAASEAALSSVIHVADQPSRYFKARLGVPREAMGLSVDLELGRYWARLADAQAFPVPEDAAAALRRDFAEAALSGGLEAAFRALARENAGLLAAAGEPAPEGWAWAILNATGGGMGECTLEQAPRPTTPPSPQPSGFPTPVPTLAPTFSPTLPPTPLPTALPSALPSSLPTDSPTPRPTPSPEPTVGPSLSPSSLPSALPSPLPTDSPTPRPTPASRMRLVECDGSLSLVNATMDPMVATGPAADALASALARAAAPAAARDSTRLVASRRRAAGFQAKSSGSLLELSFTAGGIYTPDALPALFPSEYAQVGFLERALVDPKALGEAIRRVGSGLGGSWVANGTDGPGPEVTLCRVSVHTFSPTGSPTQTPTEPPSPLPSSSPTPLPSESPTSLPTPSPTPVPTVTPAPTPSPTEVCAAERYKVIYQAGRCAGPDECVEDPRFLDIESCWSFCSAVANSKYESNKTANIFADDYFDQATGEAGSEAGGLGPDFRAAGVRLVAAEVGDGACCCHGSCPSWADRGCFDTAVAVAALPLMPDLGERTGCGEDSPTPSPTRTASPTFLPTFLPTYAPTFQPSAPSPQPTLAPTPAPSAASRGLQAQCFCVSPATRKSLLGGPKPSLLECPWLLPFLDENNCFNTTRLERPPSPDDDYKPAEVHEERVHPDACAAIEKCKALWNLSPCPRYIREDWERDRERRFLKTEAEGRRYAEMKEQQARQAAADAPVGAEEAPALKNPNWQIIKRRVKHLNAQHLDAAATAMHAKALRGRREAAPKGGKGAAKAG